MQKIKIGFVPLTRYIHLGSELEFNEYNYWKKEIDDLLEKNYY